jgi:hypothetical protein
MTEKTRKTAKTMVESQKMISRKRVMTTREGIQKAKARINYNPSNLNIKKSLDKRDFLFLYTI